MSCNNLDGLPAFFYKGISSKDMGVAVSYLNRSMTPEKRRNEHIIPGRHGSIDYGQNTYANRLIELEIMYTTDEPPEDTPESWGEFRQKSRNIAEWLSSGTRGLLYFDDEMDKAYDAVVYEPISLEEWETLPVGIVRVVFDCQPFAESIYPNKLFFDKDDIKTGSGGAFNLPSFKHTITSKGTQSTPFKVRMKVGDEGEISQTQLVNNRRIKIILKGDLI